MEELFRPFERTAALCGMNYRPPRVVYSANSLSVLDLERVQGEFRDDLVQLSSQEISA